MYFCYRIVLLPKCLYSKNIQKHLNENIIPAPKLPAPKLPAHKLQPLKQRHRNVVQPLWFICLFDTVLKSGWHIFIDKNLSVSTELTFIQYYVKCPHSEVSLGKISRGENSHGKNSHGEIPVTSFPRKAVHWLATFLNGQLSGWQYFPFLVAYFWVAICLGTVFRMK